MATKLQSWPGEKRPYHHLNFRLWSSGGVYELSRADDFPHLTLKAMCIRCHRWAHDHDQVVRTTSNKARQTLTVEFRPKGCPKGDVA